MTDAARRVALAAGLLAVTLVLARAHQQRVVDLAPAASPAAAG